MVRYTSDKGIFITYDKRSDHFWTDLSNEVKDRFGGGPFEDQKIVTEVLLFCYDWLSEVFVRIIHSNNDANFVYYLFGNHERSIRLWIRILGGEDLEANEGIPEHTLALNRRILKLALEQTCDVDYTFQSKLTPRTVKQFILQVEDILYLGTQLYGIADHLAHLRMMEDPLRLYFNDQNILVIEMKHHYESIMEATAKLFHVGFRDGIVSQEMVVELKDKVKECMGIDYDFASYLVNHIKNHHNPEAPECQTIEPNVLPENLINNGVSEVNANAFYDGLTISRLTKLQIKDAIYQNHSMRRYMFRPILILNMNGKERALVGIEKWAESITVMATNGFQWQQAPEEWLKNKCFRDFLTAKHDEHDKLLEDEVETVLHERNILFDRNIHVFYNKENIATRVDVEGIGEMDFVFLDQHAKKIIVTDCKYLRAKYEMVGFSRDFSNFTINYEKKLQAKVDWVQQNIQLVKEHFEKKFPGLVLNHTEYSVEPLFITNTPTFYMLNGKYKTVNISFLNDMIESGYQYPVIEIVDESSGEITVINWPYFTVQRD